MSIRRISSLVLETEKKGVKYNKVDAKPVFNKLVDKNVNKPCNLIPTNYNQFMFTMLSDQEKWNLVFEKLKAAFDRLEDSQNDSKGETHKN